MTGDRVEELVAAATVKVSGGGSWGTGFFTSPDRVLTCAHVIEPALRAGSPVTIQAGHQTFEVSPYQIQAFPTDDVVVIDAAFGSPHQLRLDRELRLGDALYSFGYTEEFGDGDSVTVVYEGPTRGSGPLLKLKGGLVQRGMSGAPLYNPRTSAVVGMLSTSRDRRMPVGARAVPLGTINRVLALADLRSGSDPASGQRAKAMLVLTARLSIIRDELAGRRVPGSAHLTIRHLVGTDHMLMPFRTADSTSPLADQAAVASGDARHLADLLTRNRSLVLAPPGAGKSTLAIATFLAVAEDVIAGRRPVVPLLVDLRDYRLEGNSPSFGTREWLRERLAEMTGLPDQVSVDQLSEPHNDKLPSVIVVDSLDEFLAAKSPAEVRSYVSRYLFQRADVLCCRTEYYLRFLSPEQFPHHGLVMLTGFADQEIERYVRAYYAIRHDQAGGPLADEFLQRLTGNDALDTFRTSPLRLNMALDLLAPGYDALSPVRDLLGLYHAYVDGTLRREAGRAGSVLSAAAKRQFLESIAFTFYDEESVGESGSSLFTAREFERVVAELGKGSGHPVEELAEDLRSHSLLNADGAVFAQLVPGTLSFVHKSFQEYLVASYLFHTLLESATATADAFRTNLSPEVSEFLKEHLLRADARLSSRIAEIGIAAYESSTAPQDADELRRARCRIARQALGYYLGSLQLQRVRAYLRRQVAAEHDRWIRRGIIIGLAIGGDGELLHAYMDALAQERLAGGDAPENAVNNGFNLTFFGDQPFDLMQPDRDQGLPACRKTITKLIYQMNSAIDRGSWRLDLHSILDIWQYRPASAAQCAEVLRDQLPALTALLRRFRADEMCRSWPELDQLEELISTFSD